MPNQPDSLAGPAKESPQVEATSSVRSYSTAMDGMNTPKTTLGANDSSNMSLFSDRSSTLCSLSTTEPPGLFEFPTGVGEAPAVLDSNARHVDIIAVHGLGGNWELTWTADDGAIWLRDRLPGILAKVNVEPRIRSFGYDSATVLSSSVNGLNTTALSLLASLKRFRTTPEERRTPIIFVCHSLGGLVVKLALTQAWHFKDIMDMVKGCLFLGVPHGVSSLANRTDSPEDVLKGLSDGFTDHSEFVERVRKNSNHWVYVSDNFVERAKKLHFRSFFETKKYENMIVVDQSSATMHVENEVVNALKDSNHRTICKFRDNDDQRFSPVGESLRELVELCFPVPEVAERQPLCSRLIPCATNTFFGRESELHTMIDVLDPFKPGPKGIVVYGLPGTGKTELALRYIEQHRGLFSSIFWINSSSRDSISTSYSEAVAMIASNWPLGDFPIPYLGFDDRRRVISRLRSTRYTRWLLVIDNTEEEDEQNLSEYLPGLDCLHGSIIVTSTRKDVADVLRMEGLEIGGLSPDEGHQLLLARIFKAPAMSLPNMSLVDENAARAIATEFDCIPLAIEHAAALICLKKSTPHKFISEYREHYKRLTGEEIPKEFFNYNRSRSLYALLSVIYSTIQKESPIAAALLNLLAFIGQRRIPASMLNLSEQYYDKHTIGHILGNCTEEHLKSVLCDQAARSLAIGHLSDTGLIRIDGDAASFNFLTIDNSVCQLIVESVSPNEQWILRVAALLTSYVLPSQDALLFPPSCKRDEVVLCSPLKRCKSLLSRYRKSSGLTERDGRYTSLPSNLDISLALSYLYLKRYEDAKNQFHESIEHLKLKQGALWPSGETALRLLYGLAITHQKSNEPEEALEYLRVRAILQ